MAEEKRMWYDKWCQDMFESDDNLVDYFCSFTDSELGVNEECYLCDNGDIILKTSIQDEYDVEELVKIINEDCNGHQIIVLE